MHKAFGKTLLAWYAKDQRKLPWRRTKDPYKIWVSEVMLQQTQVQTVLAYYRRWLKSFPTLKALAEASEHEVLKAWQGLGYYRRAGNLKKAAMEILARHGGAFPQTLEEIRALPGVGAYTAGAVASIAFNQSTVALDVNVLRVASRLLLIKKNPKTTASREAIGKKVQQWIPAGRARWFNQALMELGALICLPANPLCMQCPVQAFCQAYRKDMQDRIPIRVARAKRIAIDVVAGVLRDGRDRALIQKRPADGLMGNLWEFPGGKVHSGESLEHALAREWKEELGVVIESTGPIMTIAHAYTKFDVRLHVHTCRLVQGRPKALWADEIRWVGIDQLDDFAFPSANARIVRWLKTGKTF